MSEPAERVLLELPAEFRGMPYADRSDAQDWAEATVPYAALVTHLGEAVAEQTVVHAAAYRLSSEITDRLRFKALVDDTLARLPRASGRGRHAPFSV